MTGTTKGGWWWVPSLYYAQGLPYVVVMVVSVIMYKRLGISNTEIALYTSWLYLPWVIKPLWSPLVDLVRTRRIWIVAMQLLVGGGLAGVALTLPAPGFFRWSLAFLWLLAFASATHDIAADGFYMMGLSDHDQAWFVGVRSTFYRAAMITGQGLIVILAGFLETSTGLDPLRVDVVVEAPAEGPPPGILRPGGTIPPDSLGFPVPAPARNRTALVVGEGEVRIVARPVDAEAADSLAGAARDWNERFGFTPGDQAASPGPADDGPSWWTRSVSGPLGRWIAGTFGERSPPARADRRAGNLAVIPVWRSGSTDRPTAAVFSLEDGDPSIRIVAGERLVFGPGILERPALVVVQLDPKLDRASSARFVARSGNVPLAWSISLLVLAGLFVAFFLWHGRILPRPDQDRPGAASSIGPVLAGFAATFASFFRRPGIGVVLAFLLLYRFAEAQLVKLASPFLLDGRDAGGLALTTGEVGFVYGTVGIVALTLGGLLGGFLAARDGLKRWLWWMVAAINVPNVVYVWLAWSATESLWAVNAAVAVEQFGYGFGFTAYLLYMIYVSRGEHKTAHYAICTGFMALGMMLPGMFSGWLEDLVGYRHFFVWVVVATLPAFAVAAFIRLEDSFGRRDAAG